MKISEEIKDKIIIICTVIIIILVIITIYQMQIKEETLAEEVAIIETTTVLEKNNNYYVDIKGAVKKPGVYMVKEGTIVNDVIKLAGGLKSNAYTKNINLSQKTFNEMVIYIFNNSEMKKSTTVKTDTTCKTEVIEINNCITTTTQKTDAVNKLININTASLTELTSLSGVGESKAKAIIEYRNTNKFEKIDDIKNVSGIGDLLFDSIKNYITV